ncbi:MAG TPA: PAS domain-containing protein, partial [Blastocatellia bacterium]
IAREKKAYLTNDVMNDPRVNDKGWAQYNGMVAFAGYPMVVEDRLIGVAALFARHPLSESTLDTLASVVDMISQGIERRRAEEALRNALEEIQRSESKLQRVIDAIPALAWCNLPDGPNEFLNKGWHDYTGLSPEEAHGWGWQGTFHPEDLPPLMEKWVKMLTSGEPDEVEARIRRHDGVYRWFLIRAEPFRDELGHIVRWYGTSTDIDDRKLAEEALRSNERNLTLIINTMPALAWSALPDGSTDFISQRWLDYTGLSLEQALGWGWTAAIHPNDLSDLTDYWRSIMRTGGPGETEARFRRFDGEYRWFLFRANALRDESGTIIKWYGTNTEIDDRKRAEEALTRARSELAHIARVTTLSALTTSIAHEINQPIAAAVTSAGACLRWLNREQPDLQRAREAAMRIENDGRRAAEIISHLRAFYRKEISPQRAIVSINDIVGEMLGLLRGEAGRHSVVMRTDLAPDLTAVVSDRVQLQQVLMNLMLNAMEAMSERGGELKISTRCQGGEVLVSVSDTGVGIPAEKIDQIFNAFFTTKAEGMGMGLAISNTIIDSHGGRLWATMNPERGATFHFTIPTEPETT